MVHSIFVLLDTASFARDAKLRVVPRLQEKRIAMDVVHVQIAENCDQERTMAIQSSRNECAMLKCFAGS